MKNKKNNLENKRWLLLIFGLFLFVLIIFLFFSSQQELRQNPKLVIIDKKHIFQIETAITSEQKNKGLGGREYLCKNCGVLFLFDKSEKYSFWMKDMLFPLDILWIKNGRVVYIAKNISADFSKIIKPTREADSVLEINAGICDDLDIREGSSVSFF